MKITQVLVESVQATVAFAFGRFNPAHQGHIAVWRTVEEAGKNWFVGTNPNTIGPNDPLTFQEKSAWMEEIYPPISGHIVPQTTVLTLAAYIFKKLRNNESATIAYVTDDTDWAWSGKLLNQYNGVEGAHGYYKFAQITHVPSPRVSSATALRDAARADDKVAFYHASGTDPKLKVAGLSYFDTVKQACEKYPLPVKKVKKIKEAPDANFVGFMNKAMNTRQDNKPLAYDPKTVMSMDTMPGYKKAFKFGMDVIKKMDPDTKQEFANAPDDTLFSYMMNIAEKKGYAPEQFMSEDLDEVTGEFEEIFHDPDMEGWTWTDLLRDMIGMEPRALSKANVQAHKKEFSHAQQMAAKGPGPIDPNKLKAITRSDTKQTEIWYPVNTYNEAQGWVIVATGFQNKEQAEQKLAQMKQDPGVNKTIQAALNKKKNESISENIVPIAQSRPTLKQAGITTPRAPLWSFQEIAQKLGISNPALNNWAFKTIGNFPEAIPGVKSSVGSTKYYNSNEIKRWVIDNNVRERIKASSSKVSEDEQKTVAKTWDQMTPQEKISGVKGRTVWNEKTRKYYTVFDVPVRQETDEASLATMRDYFAGDEEARDPYEITKQRLHFSKDKNAKPTVDKRFRSQEEYEQWLAQNKLKPISNASKWTLINKRK